mgnify:CR=1 FL=1
MTASHPRHRGSRAGHSAARGVARAGVAIFATILAGQARAQSPADARDERRLDIGLNVSGFYDSDVLRGDTIRAVRPDAKKEDFIISPRLTADIVAPIGRQAAFLNGQLGYQFHKNNGYLDRESINAQGGFRLRPLRGCMATVTGQYTQQQSELYDIVQGFDPTNVEKIGGVTTSLACQMASGLAPSISAGRTRAKNSSRELQVNEYVNDSVQASLGYSRPQLGTVSVYASIAKSRYPLRRALLPGTPADGANVYSTGLGYERQIGTRLTGSANIGYTRVNPRLPGTPDFKGASWDVDLTYDSRNRFRGSVSFARSVEQSNLIGDTYGINTSLRFTGDYAFNERFRLTAGAAYIRRKQEQSPLFQLPNFNSRDRTVSVYSRLTAGNVGPVGIAFDVSREHRKSVVPIYNYGSTRFGVTATFNWGRNR